MVDYTVDIDQSLVNFITNFAYENDLHCEYYTGVLLDNYIIENFHRQDIQIADETLKGHMYMIIYEKYLNEWSSKNVLILTDDIHLVENYRNQFEQFDSED